MGETEEMKSKQTFKTTTLLDEHDCPVISLLPGHVPLDIFNEAFIAEGWEADPWPDDYISYEYWVCKPDGTWESSHKGIQEAQPVTVAGWDGPQEPGLH
jgi:hypothetical protein